MCRINNIGLINKPISDNTRVSIKKNDIEKISSKDIPSEIKDKKNISTNLSKEIKSSKIDFVDCKNLTDQRILGTTTKIIVHEIGKKTAEKSIGKVIGKAATSTVGKSLAKSLAKNTIETAIMSAGEEITLKALEKGASKAAEKGGKELSKKISGAVPVVGAIIEAGFTLYDAKYAYDLTKQKNVSTLSKALAWATVGLDLVSTVCTATGVGTPIAWIATGLSIGTAVASDMTQ